MAFQTVFKRYEVKFMLTAQQKQLLLSEIEKYMCLDRYGKTLIKNLYLDTPTYRLARRSIEKPDYKEKLRIRSYGETEANSTVFVELKKKYKGVVYKRRIPMTESQAVDWLWGGKPSTSQSQIAAEIDYFVKYYGSLHPVAFLSYEREAYYARDGSDFRITFDDNILCRQQALSLQMKAYGTPILPEGRVLMELKCSGGIPLWMTRILSREHIYKTAFSKYGTAYQTLIFTHRKETFTNA